MPYNPDVENAAKALVQEEVSTYENPHYYITEDISFDIRNLIRQCRKNYHGIFDNPQDKVTGRDKIHPKLTQIMVENVVKNIDLDMKHFSFRSKNGRKGIPTAEILRHKTREYFKQTHFGEKLDEMERVMCIDGTAISKSYEVTRDGKKKLVTKLVDRLNFYIDLTADSIQEAHRVTERAVKPLSAVKSMDWENTNLVSSTTALNSNPGTHTSTAKTTDDVDVYECWGKIPEWIIENDISKKGNGKEVEGHIVVSGVLSDNPILHLIEKNTRKDSQGNPIRPYEEMRYRKVQGRWDGMGVAEQIWTLEMWYALTINARINRNTLSQLGIFTVRKSAGVPIHALSRMAANGVIRVDDHDDISQMPIQDAPASSYQDEQVINDIAQKLTSAFEVAVGDALPASTTATNGAIMDRNASKAWKLVRDQIGFWGNRWMDRHLKPYLAHQVKSGDVVKFMYDMEGMEGIRNRVIGHLAQKKIKELGVLPSEVEFRNAVAAAEQKLIDDGALYFSVVGKLIEDDIDAEVQLTNEDLNVGVMMSNMIQLLQLDPEQAPFYRDVIADLMGIPRPPKLPQSAQVSPLQPGQQNQAAPQTPNEIDLMTASNTLEQNGR